MSLLQSSPGLLKDLIRLSEAARKALEEMSPQERQHAFSLFPRGACGPAAELMGRIVLNETGHTGTYVCGTGHPELRPQQSHAWLAVEGYIVDLTYDQFPGTGLEGWVFKHSSWHAQFDLRSQPLCLKPAMWMEYPYAAYAAMRESCGGAHRD